MRSDYVEAYYNRGNALHELKRFEEAVASYDRALTLRPDYAEAHSNRGNALHALKRFDEALVSYDRALAVRPDDAEAHSNRAATLHELGRFEEAVVSCDRALALRPDNVDALLNRGVALNELNRFQEALSSYDRALAARPDDAAALSNRAATLHELGRFEEAVASCDRALTLRPDYAEAHSNLGNGLMNQGRLIEAEAACRRAIELKPSFADAYNNLGATLKYLGRLNDARRAVEQALELAPQNVSYFLNLSDVRHFGAGDPYLSTMEQLVKNIASLPVKQQIELHFALAKAYEDTDQRDKSFQQLLAGNTLKRRQIDYDESATLALFERIRTVFTPELMRTFQGVGEPSSIPLFIVGMPRSGTTLIEQILASHPQVFGAGELSNLEKAVAASVRREDTFIHFQRRCCIYRASICSGWERAMSPKSPVYVLMRRTSLIRCRRTFSSRASFIWRCPMHASFTPSAIPSIPACPASPSCSPRASIIPTIWRSSAATTGTIKR